MCLRHTGVLSPGKSFWASDKCPVLREPTFIQMSSHKQLLCGTVHVSVDRRFQQCGLRKVCQYATSYRTSHLAASKMLPDNIWDDSEVTPGAATVDTRMITSCQLSAKLCPYEKKGKIVKNIQQAKSIKLYFQDSILTFSILFVLSDTESETIS